MIFQKIVGTVIHMVIFCRETRKHFMDIALARSYQNSA